MIEIPRDEHPRPDFQRSAWRNLNGPWRFAIDSTKCGVEKGWHTGIDFPREIIVPFCPESRLSGSVGRISWERCGTGASSPWTRP